MTATLQERLTALFSHSSTPTLVTSLRTLDAQPPSRERNWARAKTIEELERRFPAASRAVEDAFDETEQRIVAGEPGVAEVDYVAVLLAAIPVEELR